MRDKMKTSPELYLGGAVVVSFVTAAILSRWLGSFAIIAAALAAADLVLYLIMKIAAPHK